MQYDIDEQQVFANQYYAQLNPNQQDRYTTIVQTIASQPLEAQFFMQGPAGTGKTFLYKCLCHYYWGQGKIVLYIASSGIVALWLPGGHTVHSQFKIPLATTDSWVCNIALSTQLGELLWNTALIIWDEVPMQHKYCYEGVNRSWNDICRIADHQGYFVNIPTILGSDFAQILPVVPRANRAGTVAASLQKSVLWPQFKILLFTTNIRAQDGENNAAFMTWLAKLSYESFRHS